MIKAADGAVKQRVVLSIANALHREGFDAPDIERALAALCQALPDAPRPRAKRVFRAPAQNAEAAQSAGQFDLPLAAPSLPPNVVSLSGQRRRRPVQSIEAANHFDHGMTLEEQDAVAARVAYEECLAGDCEHLEARINLGRLLHLAGELRNAEKVYAAAKRPSALLHFNFAILLEDLKRENESMAHYRSALALDPAFPDAHFNLARLHERAKQPREALRHLLAYRRLLVKYGA